jgi:arsenite oxidase small subunit
MWRNQPQFHGHPPHLSLWRRRRHLLAEYAPVAAQQRIAGACASPRQRIAGVSELTVGEPLMFQYPWLHANATNYLIKLGQQAGGGVGPEEDIVAFNSFCTHQGMSLAGQFKAEAGVVGPCPLHWTIFDLTRHGMVVAGHATLGLPQILLETDGDDIFATGVMGLIFGYHDNSVDPNSL